jgi:hypothetical protein
LHRFMDGSECVTAVFFAIFLHLHLTPKTHQPLELSAKLLGRDRGQ